VGHVLKLKNTGDRTLSFYGSNVGELEFDGSDGFRGYLRGAVRKVGLDTFKR